MAALGAASLQVAAQTAWPEAAARLRPDLSDSPVAAVLPVDVAIVSPGTDVPRSRVRWSGLWRGWACEARQCDVKIAVERVGEQNATLVYASAGASSTITHRGEAAFHHNELQLALPTGARLALRLRADADMEMSLWGIGGQLIAIGVLTRKPLPPAR